MLNQRFRSNDIVTRCRSPYYSDCTSCAKTKERQVQCTVISDKQGCHAHSVMGACYKKFSFLGREGDTNVIMFTESLAFNSGAMNT